MAIADEDRFRASLAELGPAFAPTHPDAVDDAHAGRVPSDVTGRSPRRLAGTDGNSPKPQPTLADDTRVIWYGPSMGAKSFLTARLMECWAHGQHVVDAVGVRTRGDRSSAAHRPARVHHPRLDATSTAARRPEAPVRVELDAPSGDTWTFGPDDAEQSVVGPAADFCLVVTQCRHVDATDLVVTGDDAHDWMTKAQAFAGTATDGPPY